MKEDKEIIFSGTIQDLCIKYNDGHLPENEVQLNFSCIKIDTITPRTGFNPYQRPKTTKDLETLLEEKPKYKLTLERLR